MKTFEYNTGRDYGKPQILTITVPSMPEDELDLVPVLFADSARNIVGRVTLMAGELLSHHLTIGQSVLMEYDAGRYDAI